MFFNFCSFHSDFIQKPQAVVVSAKQLVALFEDAINIQQPNTLGGSTESLKSYYKMIQQFASMAHTYRKLIPEGYNISSILELSDYVLDLKLEEFQKIANTLPSLLDGVILQDKRLFDSEVAVDPSWEITVAALSENLPSEIDLTDNSQDKLVFKAATDLMNSYPDISALQNLDRWLTSSPEKYKNAMLLASKLALSKMYIKQIDSTLHVSLVLAMYNEHNRIRSKSSDNPYGEDFARRKVDQMDWLLKDSPVTFNMVFVDDGCPCQSGEIAEGIIGSEGYRNVKVICLDDGIKCQSPIVKGLESTNDSQKGGSIQYGMWQALEDFSEGDNRSHIVIYTDADMAAPVNQIGFLLEKQNDKTMVTIASRYDAGSICRGPWGMNGEVQGLTEFDRLMVGLRSLVFSKLFPQIGKITDTQCGLKAFNAKLLRQILLKTEVRTFSFDIELLLLAADAGSAIASAPIYWHDSLAESSFWRQAAQKQTDEVS
jgi:hypothetical protein